jgi:1A family penicillin-binding protein
MARKRTGKKLLPYRRLPDTILGWILYAFELIGRFTYKVFIIFIIGFLKSLYYAVYAVYDLLLYILKLYVFLIKNIVHLFVQLFKQIKSFRIPKIKGPSLKIKSPSFLKVKLPVLKIKAKNFLFFFIFILGFTLSLYFYINILKDLPGPDKLITRDQIVSTKIYDRQQRLLYTVFNGSQNRSLVKLNDLPDYVVTSTVAVEDKDFYKHPGFSIRGITRAIWQNLSSSELQGGSTITQQLIKNALLTPEKTWQRKLKELILSIQAELIFSKDDILQMYFNEVPYGGTAYGIEEASQTYFGISATEVNLAQAALLAGLPAAPTKFSPFGANPKMAVTRQHQVLDAMVAENYISKEEAKNAKSTKIVLKPQTSNIKAPHFVMYVKDLLVEKYGTKMVEQGGLRVITSLDLDIQAMSQKYVTEEVDKLANMNITNGAALVTNPKTGEVLAMVGSRDYFDQKMDGNVNVTIMPRQPGSSIKIITYALALENNFTPATIIPDTPITYRVPGSQPYSPVNYDNNFHGNITLRTALACSYNVPAVKTLAVLGVDNMIDKAQSMGITSWQDRSRYGLALTLGSGEVKMTEMAVAYGTLATLGQKVDLKPILEITDYKGRVLSDFVNGRPDKVIDANVAYLLTDILKDNQARTPAFGSSSYLVIPNNEVAVKTGTTNDKRDNWTIGYTQDYLVAVWVGNNDNTPMSAVASGITGASPIWNFVLSSLLQDKQAHQFNKPAGLKQIEVCSINGFLPCDGCPTIKEYFLPGTEPRFHCNSDEVKKIVKDKEKKQHNNILQGLSTAM